MISDPNNLPHIQNSMAEFSFSEIDQNIEIMNQFMEINPSPNTNFHNVLGFSSENFTFHPQLGITASSGQNFHESYNHSDEKNQLQVISEVIPLLLEENQTGEKKKRTSIDLGDSSSWNSSSQVSEDGVRTKKNSRKGKRSRGNEEGEEKLKEVVHVRARRGQATDSHSLAERVRRGKINEKLKSLQDIVPGCYKTMGMAVMLDEIINYVQSLQTQVEFLSMKLAAASRFYDFNLDTDAMEAMQNAKAYEEQKAQRILGEEFQHQGLMNSTQLGSFDLTFGTYPQLPYST